MGLFWFRRTEPVKPLPSGLSTSIIIPTYNEEGTIRSTISAIQTRAKGQTQIIVADGHSKDNTHREARQAGATVLSVRGGRAAQLNAGALKAQCGTVLFLHADTLIPPQFDVEIARTLQRPNVIAGAFQLGIDSERLGIRTVEWFANLRARYLQRPYGDQGLFLTKENFNNLGGYPNMPFLEDYEMVRRISRKGRIVIADTKVITSARRWEKLGVATTTMMNQAVILGYHFGVSVDRLSGWYRGVLRRNKPTQIAQE